MEAMSRWRAVVFDMTCQKVTIEFPPNFNLNMSFCFCPTPFSFRAVFHSVNKAHFLLDSYLVLSFLPFVQFWSHLSVLPIFF